MKTILLKGLNKSYKSKIVLFDSLIDKVKDNRIKKNKDNIKTKLIKFNKNYVIPDIYLPLSLKFKKITENNESKKKPYCFTESNINSENQKNQNYFRKLKVLPKIKETNKFPSKQHIYLGMNKYSLNLNSGSALSCGKILTHKNNIINESNENDDKTNNNIKKIALKEIVFTKDKSEKKVRTIGYRIKIKRNFNSIMKNNRQLNMNDMIISNDFHINNLNKNNNIDDNLYKNINKINNLKKIPLNKNDRNNIKNEVEQCKTYDKIKSNENKNESIESSTKNKKNTLDTSKKKHNRSFGGFNKLNSVKKISNTISNISNINDSENRTNIVQGINMQRYIPKKIRIKNNDIIDLLEKTNN